MIVRDEAEHLRGCLESVAGLFDELIVVDTGSVDDSRTIAAGLGARVFEFPWIDDFAAARNFAKDQARGQWVMWLDADERIPNPSHAPLQALLDGLSDLRTAYLMRTRCGLAGDGTDVVIDHVRLFPNASDARWEGRVHEQLVPSLKRLDQRLISTAIWIEHFGYSSPELVAQKNDRNLRLLEIQVAERPEDAYSQYCLGAAYLDAGDITKAIELLSGALHRYDRNDLLYARVTATLVRAFVRSARPHDALRVGESWLKGELPNPEILYEVAMAQRQLRDYGTAEHLLQQVLLLPPPTIAACMDLGLESKAKHALAGVLWSQNRKSDAIRLWHQLVTERPTCVLGWKGLGMVALAEQDAMVVEQIATRLDLLAGGRVEALILRSQACTLRGDIVAGRGLLEEAVAMAPRDVWAKLLLAQCLLRDRSQWAAAEQVLENVLRLDPANQEAIHNLGVLRRVRRL